ncbi:hypothetical protein J437_LFUL016724 [Ladona fulva]|uniref:DNA mismatch repair protein Mlh1 C-terminal domain-containing protein n=1 Tax=Ladona fulva TaxID=123851 RepID=A0A8K0KKF2_LADFU|nr:hypothetical protein J437_LFUL016724 [Ladona fulva]
MVDGVFPCIEYLPMWILRLASEINWAEEKECFESLCRETSKLYAYSFRTSSSDDQDSDDDESGDPDLKKKEKDSSLSQDISDSQISEPGTSTGTQDEKISKGVDNKKDKWKYIVEHILYAAFRKTLLPPKHFAKDGTVLQIADLPNLYKVFERC